MCIGEWEMSYVSVLFPTFTVDARCGRVGTDAGDRLRCGPRSHYGLPRRVGKEKAHTRTSRLVAR